MRAIHCLNCGTRLRGKYCHNCGQKADTHRINLSGFVQHDLIHGVWHVDKGVFYTIRMLALWPGRAARAFIEGKRVKFFNIFTLFIVTVTLKVLIETWYQGNQPVVQLYEKKGQGSDHLINQSIENYYKFFYLLGIPLLASFTALFFRKLRYNFAEHMVLSAFLLTGGLFYTLLLLLICIAARWEFTDAYSGMLVATYGVVGLFQASCPPYRWYSSAIRCLLSFFCFLCMLFFLFLGIIAAVNGGGFEGRINV